MNTPKPSEPSGYKLSFIINTTVGSVMLLLAAVGFILESLFPSLQGALAWGFLMTAVVCLFIASLHYSKHLSMKR